MKKEIEIDKTLKEKFNETKNTGHVKYPNWIYVDDNNKKKVIPSELGDSILNKTHFLLVENDDKGNH